MDERGDRRTDQQCRGGHTDDGLALPGPSGRYRLAQMVEGSVGRPEIRHGAPHQAAQCQFVPVAEVVEERTQVTFRATARTTAQRTQTTQTT